MKEYLKPEIEFLLLGNEDILSSSVDYYTETDNMVDWDDSWFAT